MRFATIDNGSADGRLHIVSRDGRRSVPAENSATLQDALEHWDQNHAVWRRQFEHLTDGDEDGMPFDQSNALAPLPRAWQWLDGSAFDTHIRLIQEAWGQTVTGLPERPLMYQGISDRFLKPHGPAPFPSDQDGIDFEGEYGVIVGKVPMGTKADKAADYIRLIVLINDWSLRALGPIEMATGFGWLQCKPACSVAPVTVTPDELGEGWKDNRVCMPLNIRLNGEQVGSASGGEMAFGFNQLIEHAAYSRDLPAGTIIGSGTVANSDYKAVGSSCIAEIRAIEQIETGTGKTPFLVDGDQVEMSVADANGEDVFGSINQTVRIQA